MMLTAEIKKVLVMSSPLDGSLAKSVLYSFTQSQCCNVDLAQYLSVIKSATAYALSASTPCSGLLLGNGASMAVWQDFYYESLFEKTKSIVEKPLSQTELSVFAMTPFQEFDAELEDWNQLRTSTPCSGLLIQHRARR